MDNPSTSPQQPRCPPGQGCANPRTALPRLPHHPRVIPARPGLVRSRVPEPPRLSTSAVHLSTSPLLLVTQRHGACLKITHRAAQTGHVTDGDSAATARHGMWITVDNSRTATDLIDWVAIGGWDTLAEIGRRSRGMLGHFPSSVILRHELAGSRFNVAYVREIDEILRCKQLSAATW